MPVWYNENNYLTSEWLRNPCVAGYIASGEVDARSIEEVSPDDVSGVGQRHFFAGIGAWSHALRLAGVPDDACVWTGSCPCQPFSLTGKRAGFSDPRHLWPAWFNLITECKPPIIFGEQVASRDGLAWLDNVYLDLESAGYAVGAADLCAAGIGAPHRRQRLYFGAFRVDQPSRSRLERLSGDEYDRSESGRVHPESSGPVTSPSEVNGFWRGAEWILCRDGKERPIEPGLLPLVNGPTQRLGRLRAYGNAIVPQVAAEFIKAILGERGWI